MALGAYVRILDAARLQAPGCLDGTLRMELFNATKDFLRRTDAWREEIEVPTVPGVSDYELPVWGNGVITRLIWLEGQRVPVTPQDPKPRGTQQRGYLLNPSASATILRIGYTPAASETWYAHVALACGDPTDGDGLPRVPEWIVETYHDYLLSGLLSRVLMHPSKPYSNLNLAMFHGRRFNEGIGVGRKEAANGYRLGGQAWVFPQTFRTRTQRVW